MTARIAVALNSHLPEGWVLDNLINLDPDWQVNICDGEFVVVATGETIEDALAAATTKTLDESQYCGRLASLPRRTVEPPQDNSLLARLGLLRAQAPIKRRI